MSGSKRKNQHYPSRPLKPCNLSNVDGAAYLMDVGASGMVVLPDGDHSLRVAIYAIIRATQLLSENERGREEKHTAVLPKRKDLEEDSKRETVPNPFPRGGRHVAHRGSPESCRTLIHHLIRAYAAITSVGSRK